MEEFTMPDGYVMHLKKGVHGEWRGVYPLYDSDGKVIWINMLFGGWNNLLILAIIMFIVLALFYGFNDAVSQYRQIAANPCAYCNPVNATNFSSLFIKNDISIWGGEDG